MTNLADLFFETGGRNARIKGMFQSCKELTDVSAINDWYIISGTDFTHMFWLERKDGHSTLPVFTKRKGAWDDNGTFTPE